MALDPRRATDPCNAQAPYLNRRRVHPGGKFWPMIHRLNQATIWVDGEGQVVELEEMEPSYRRNLLAFLERKAELLAKNSGEYVTVRHDDDGWSALFQLAQESEQPFDEWLASKPLVRRLRSLVADDTKRRLIVEVDF